MKTDGYLYIIRGNDYEMPYKECIKSIQPLCENIIVLTDPRFDDGTIKELEKLDKVRIISEEFDWNNPGIDGIAKGIARSYCESEWLLQMDADEILREEDINKIHKLLTDINPNINLITTGVINWFNGNHIKTTSPHTKPRISRNIPNITHGIPVPCRVNNKDTGYIYSTEASDGAGYIDTSHNGTYHAELDVCNWNNLYNSIKSDIWIHHYSWYSLPRKWEMKNTWEYMWGLLHGKYNSLNDYSNKIEDKRYDFWEKPTYKSLQDYMLPIHDEMIDDNIYRCEWIQHPNVIKDWLKGRRIYGEKSSILPMYGRMPFYKKLRNMVIGNKKQYEF
tara:strand:- start:824 stop:1825 length:1002 start_codon:yes stop_codon:yes gene_type:complete